MLYGKAISNDKTVYVIKIVVWVGTKGDWCGLGCFHHDIGESTVLT